MGSGCLESPDPQILESNIRRDAGSHATTLLKITDYENNTNKCSKKKRVSKTEAERLQNCSHTPLIFDTGFYKIIADGFFFSMSEAAHHGLIRVHLYLMKQKIMLVEAPAMVWK